MKLHFANIKETPLNILRRLGYAFLRRDERTGELSFVRRVGAADFPRFHIFVKTGERGKVELTLHLDQKKPSYSDSTAHSGEYKQEGWLAKEAAAIKKAFEEQYA